MKLGRLFYVIISTIIIIVIILVSNLFSHLSFNNNLNSNVTKIYFADNISSAHKEVIELFNKLNRGHIEVVPINLPFEKFSTNDRKELLARYFRSKSDRIDVFSVDQIWVPRFARWAVPLERYFPDSSRTSLLKYALNTCYYNDTLIAVPLYIDIALMYYRKDIIDRLKDSDLIEDKLKQSITWQDLIELNNRFKDSPFFVFQGDDYEGLICIYSEILANMHGELMKNDSLLIKSPQAEKALQFLIDLINKYKISPKEVLRFKEDDSYKYYLQNNGIFLRGWKGLFKNNLMGRKYMYLKDVVDVVPTPHIKGAKPASVFGGWNLMVSKYSSKVRESIKFIKFLSGETAQKILFEHGGFIPVNNIIYHDSLYLQNNPDLLNDIQLVKNGIYRPFSERYTHISDILSYYINLSLKGDLSPHNALHKAYDKINSKSILLK